MGSQPPTPGPQQAESLDSFADVSQSTLVSSFHRSPAFGAGVLDPQQGADKHSASGDEVLNTHAVEVLERVQGKLTGRDFHKGQLGVEDQVYRLIEEAISAENLCRHYIGWCSYW